MISLIFQGAPKKSIPTKRCVSRKRLISGEEGMSQKGKPEYIDKREKNRCAAKAGRKGALCAYFARKEGTGPIYTSVSKERDRYGQHLFLCIGKKEKGGLRGAHADDHPL